MPGPRRERRRREPRPRSERPRPEPGRRWGRRRSGGWAARWPGAQLGTQHERRGRPVGRVLGQAGEHQPLERRVYGHPERGQGGRRLGQLGQCGGEVGAPNERRLAGQELVEHAPGGVHVGAAVEGRGRHLLGRQVAGGADNEPLPGDVGHRCRPVLQVDQLLDPGHAEVGHLHPGRRPVLDQEEVGGLDVPVDEPGPVGHVEGLGHLGHERHRHLGRHPAAGHQVAHGPARHQLHHHEVDGAVGPGVVGGHDARVGQPGRRHRLPPEALAERRVAGQMEVRHLDRHRSGQDLVPALPHGGHAPLGQQPHQPVAADQDLLGDDSRPGTTGFGHWGPGYPSLPSGHARGPNRVQCTRRPPDGSDARRAAG